VTRDERVQRPDREELSGELGERASFVEANVTDAEHLQAADDSGQEQRGRALDLPAARPDSI
jgi:hypothetical protein